MELIGQQLIAAPIDRTWVALNDPGTLKACIAGCDAIDKVSDNEYTVSMTVRIGPVNAKFKGKLKLENLEPPRAYTIAFEGQGGVAGFGKGSADVKLTPQDGGTLLDYAARAQVGGKIAQIGSRLVDAAAKKMADDFFAAFNAKVGTVAPAAAEPAAEAGSGPATADVSGAAGAPVAAAASTAGTAPAPAASAGVPTWLWVIGAAVAGFVVGYMAR